MRSNRFGSPCHRANRAKIALFIELEQLYADEIGLADPV
jgi:hypothetical protein